VRARTGFLPDVPGLYPWMTAREFLFLVGRLFGLDAATIAARADALLEMAGLAAVTAQVGGFSRGMKQRLGIAQALMNAPSLLMLDEPTSALDPIGRREVLEMIASLRGRTTVFFSTHILADVERVCDAVAILESGRVVANASVAELRARSASNRLTVEVEDTGAVLAMTRALTGQPWLRSLETVDRTLRLTVSDLPTAQRDVPAVIAATGVALRRFEIEEGSLEDVFVDLVGGASQ
jgi:ABC-2 type transport system ATP-binding protein